MSRFTPSSQRERADRRQAVARARAGGPRPRPDRAGDPLVDPTRPTSICSGRIGRRGQPDSTGDKTRSIPKFQKDRLFRIRNGTVNSPDNLLTSRRRLRRASGRGPLTGSSPAARRRHGGHASAAASGPAPSSDLLLGREGLEHAVHGVERRAGARSRSAGAGSRRSRGARSRRRARCARPLLPCARRRRRPRGGPRRRTRRAGPAGSAIGSAASAWATASPERFMQVSGASRPTCSPATRRAEAPAKRRSSPHAARAGYPLGTRKPRCDAFARSAGRGCRARP